MSESSTAEHSPQHIPLKFIGESIEAMFDTPPTLTKRPGCPDSFVWRGETFEIDEKLSEWHDYSRKGRMAHNMREEHAETASRRGSWGVGRFYFRVLTDADRIFDLYYDRAPSHAGDRSGSWHLYREMVEGDS